MLNKSDTTHIVAATCVTVGWALKQPELLTVGLYALSGAITNWLAVHMLFEKVPLLYGSGVIPARFDEFKRAIERLIMEQFLLRLT